MSEPARATMYTCPRCNQALVQHPEEGGISWYCEACTGRAIGFSVLRKSIGGKRMAEILAVFAQTGGVGDCPCPICSKAMKMAAVDVEGQELTLDLCQLCSFVWFDPAEYEAIPPAPDKPHVLGEVDMKKLPIEMREKLAMVQVQAITEKARAEDKTPDSNWKVVPAFFGLPVEMDSTYSTRTPWATYLLSLLIAAISIAAFFHLDTAVETFGLVPDEAMRFYGLTFLSSFFIHAGIIHLIGNLYFLLTFGRAVESYLGIARWLLLVFLADQVGNLIDMAIDPNGSVPLVGASGGISGVIAFYALQFPKQRLGFFFNLGIWFRWIRFPAWVALVLWIALQAWGAFQQVAGNGDVASLAHLGGAVVGFVFWLMWRNSPWSLSASPASRSGHINVTVQ